MIKIKTKIWAMVLIIFVGLVGGAYALTMPEEVTDQNLLDGEDSTPYGDFENLDRLSENYAFFNLDLGEELNQQYNNNGLELQMPVKVDEVYEEEELVQEQIMEEEIMQYEKEIKAKKTEGEEETEEGEQVVDESIEQRIIGLEKQQNILKYILGASGLIIMGLLIFIFHKFKFKKKR
ncbi:hypothetical protein KY313_01505 [Candidatus Woesearchaeota archaeon]|nr:hypothetical protein [Candidatus Woesearchaeota archaeon]